jgi:hypothetical protein
MVYRKPAKNSLKKRSQRELIMSVSEEVYLLDDKKVVNTQHVQYIETLSRAQIIICCRRKIMLMVLWETPVQILELLITARRVESNNRPHYPKNQCKC